MATETATEVHINRRACSSPNPTTGEALYVLGQVPEDHDLYRGENGDGDDGLIDNSAEMVNVRDREHFHSRPRKVITVVVNGKRKPIMARTLSFERVVALAFDPVPSGPNICFTVTYYNGPRSNPKGSMVPGDSVKVQEGMVFNVTATDKS